MFDGARREAASEAGQGRPAKMAAQPWTFKGESKWRKRAGSSVRPGARARPRAIKEWRPFSAFLYCHDGRPTRAVKVTKAAAGGGRAYK